MNRLPVLLASIATLTSLAFVQPVFAQEAEAPDTEMAQYQFSGVLNADNVYVRSGASENDYPVIKLSKGDSVVVVDTKLDWLKILPPEGSYCLVGKAWVDRRGEGGTLGRVRDDHRNVNARYGSVVTPNMIQKVAKKLNGGEDLQIIGEQDEYFKVVPPAGTFMYVHKKFVDLVKRVEVVSNNGKMEVKPVDPAGAATPSNVVPGTVAGAGSTTATPGVAAPEAGRTPENTVAGAPTTAPSPVAAAANAEFDALEARFNEASAQPIEQQPIDELLAGYQKLVNEKKLPENATRIAEFRLKGLQVRKDALAQLQEVKKIREEAAIKRKPIEAEATEIRQRLKENEVKQFTAVGTLRASALTANGRPLYRLTDPASGRTVVYIMTDDAKVIGNEGSFLGVRGEITDDAARKIKVISPREVEQIDPAAVTRGSVVSTITPPSLIPSAASAQQ